MRVQLIYGKAFSLSIPPFLCSPTLTFSCTDWLMIRGRCCVHVLDFIPAQLPYCSSLSTATVSLSNNASEHIVRNVHVPCQSKISRDIWQISCEIWNRPRWKFSKKPNAANRFWQLLFPFAGVPAKCRRNGSSVQVPWGICVQQTPKVLRVRSSFRRAGEKKFRRQTNRARNNALCTHLGPC